MKNIQDKSKKPVRNDLIIINPDRQTRLDMKMAHTQEGYFVARNDKASIFEYNKDEIPEPPEVRELKDHRV